MQHNWFNSRKRETGKRYNVRAVLPHNGSAEHLALIENIKIQLCADFGGFTSNASNGGWLEDGQLIEEESITFNVSFTDAADTEKARQLFTVAGLLLGNDWIHIELSTFSAMHTKAKG